MIEITYNKDLYVPKIGYEVFEYDYNIIKHSLDLKEDQVMIWVAISINETFMENQLPDVLYICYSDLEISNQNKLISNVEFKKSVLDMFKFILNITEMHKFYITSYITYIENSTKNKNYFLDSISAYNIPFRYINPSEHIFQNQNVLRDFRNIPLIKTNVMYIANKEDSFKKLYDDLKNKYLVCGDVVYIKNKNSKSSYTKRCCINEFKSILADEHSITYNLASYITRSISNLSFHIDYFVFEFDDFYIDYVNNVVYLKNENEFDFFKKYESIKIIKDVYPPNVKFFSDFKCKNLLYDFVTDDLIKLIKDIFLFLSSNKKIIFTGDIDVYKFIKKFMKKIFVENSILILIEDHHNIFYKQSSFETMTMLYNKDTEIYDFNLNIENFKNVQLTYQRTMSILVNSFLFKND